MILENEAFAIHVEDDLWRTHLAWKSSAEYDRSLTILKNFQTI